MSTTKVTQPPQELLSFIRILAAVLVPALLVAFVILYFFPSRTGELFAWPIAPTMTAMMLGATYLGGAYFFTRVVLTRQWHHVKLGFLPVTAFAGVLGIATVLHWDRFTHGHIAFHIWALLYFAVPFVLPVAWYRNNRAAAPQAGLTPLPQTLRFVFGGLGGVLSLVSLLMLVVPTLLIPTWPWALTPLTTRVMAAMFALTGLVCLGIAVDGRWQAARYILHAQIIAIVFILLAVVRAWPQFDWSRPVSWLFIGGLSFVLVVALGVLTRLKPVAAPALTTR
jgi:hypothetical protein